MQDPVYISGNFSSLAAFDSQLTADLDTIWLLFGAVLVFFMQTGFAMLEVGTVSSKNTSNILLKNVLDASLGSFVWWIVGFGIAIGDSSDSGGFIGSSMFALNFADFAAASPTSGYSYGMWLFQWAFAATTATIVSGTVAERCSFTAYMTYSFCLTGFIYPVVVCWGWNTGGWASAWKTDTDDLLFGCGVIDFAGSGVVHMTGGVAAFVGASFLGPRAVRGGKDAKHLSPLPAGYAPVYGPIFQTLGTLILWMGWYGFNGVSTLYLVNYGMVAAKTMVTTTISAGTGALSTLFIGSLLSPRSPSGGYVLSLGHANNGVLAGLVAITAPCSTCEPYAAFIIGFLAGPVYLSATYMLELLAIDDVVSAIPVHGACGFFGVVMAALFATPENYGNAYYSDRAEDCAGLFYAGNGSSLGAAAAFLFAVIAWVGVLSTVVFGILSVAPGNLLRVTEDVEEAGMDSSEHGVASASAIVPGGEIVEKDGGSAL